MIEISSPSTRARDYLLKLKVYQNCGVREYWLVDPLDDSVTVYDFTAGEGDVRRYSFSDTIQSVIFPELSLTIAEYLDELIPA